MYFPFNSQHPTSSIFEPSDTLVVSVDSDSNVSVRPLENVPMSRSDYTLNSLLLAGIDPSSVSFSSASGSRLQKAQELDSLNLDSLFDQPNN